ncbi:hypothetical protein JYK14_07765 [Siccirubricoccus sp. KC 17139]|uniref:DinB family protein n=1 Tax=Siccirubricoccus soli TaxID=2899147 RepID=A0ABT1D2B5_9PROT|nr:hypothetical protein [Siccirubricoccus soli]MCO6416066.1 hypothetical protein [Siccirubricoccus soli]MCP2682198.1 hypothetical protein [Siccirubricoccus soli]
MEPLPFPASLRLVAENIARGQDHTSAIKEFVDHLARAVAAAGWADGDPTLPVPRAAFEEEPPLPDVPWQRAHIGGLAEHLARLAGESPPEWCLGDAWFLPEPIGRTVEGTPPELARRGLMCGPVLGNLWTRLGVRPRLPAYGA